MTTPVPENAQSVDDVVSFALRRGKISAAVVDAFEQWGRKDLTSLKRWLNGQLDFSAAPRPAPRDVTEMAVSESMGVLLPLVYSRN